jgi:hypothetical protein
VRLLELAHDDTLASCLYADAQQQTKKHKAVAVPQMIPNAAAAPTKVDEKSLSILTAAGVVKATGAAAAAAAASAILALRRPPVPLFVAGTSNTRPSSSAAGAAGASPKTAAAADAVKVLPKATPVPMASATKPLSVGFDAFDHEKVAPGAWSFWVQDTATVRVVCPLGGTRKRGFFGNYSLFLICFFSLFLRLLTSASLCFFWDSVVRRQVEPETGELSRALSTRGAVEVVVRWYVSLDLRLSVCFSNSPRPHTQTRPNNL